MALIGFADLAPVLLGAFGSRRAREKADGRPLVAIAGGAFRAVAVAAEVPPETLRLCALRSKAESSPRSPAATSMSPSSGGAPAHFFARRMATPLTLTEVISTPRDVGLPMRFDIAIGVRKSDAALRERVDAWIATHGDVIRTLLPSE